MCKYHRVALSSPARCGTLWDSKLFDKLAQLRFNTFWSFGVQQTCKSSWKQTKSRASSVQDLWPKLPISTPTGNENKLQRFAIATVATACVQPGIQHPHRFFDFAAVLGSAASSYYILMLFMVTGLIEIWLLVAQLLVLLLAVHQVRMLQLRYTEDTVKKLPPHYKVPKSQVPTINGSHSRQIPIIQNSRYKILSQCTPKSNSMCANKCLDRVIFIERDPMRCPPCMRSKDQRWDQAGSGSQHRAAIIITLLLHIARG